MPLTEKTTHIITIATSATDVYGGNPMSNLEAYAFTTIDLTPPNVVFTSPPAGKLGAESNITVIVGFDEPILLSSVVLGTTFRLTDIAGVDITPAGVISWGASNTLLSYTISLGFLQKCYIKVRSSANVSAVTGLTSCVR